MVRRLGLSPLLSLAALLAAGADGALAAPRVFGHYTGTASVTTSPFYPPGAYDVEAMVAETETGIVGYVNIAYEPGDVLSGIITHTFSAVRNGDSTILTLKYSDRLCGGGDRPDKCYPHAATNTQYSFGGLAVVLGKQLTLAQPTILPALPYTAVLPFDSIQLVRTPNLSRTSFDGLYHALDYVWLGTIFVTLPLPLLGTNRVLIDDGEILDWKNNGNNIPTPGVINEWCYDDASRRGWMIQQSKWAYDWLLDPEGRGVTVIAKFALPAPDCRDLPDVLSGGGLDTVHKNLVGMMYEPAPPVDGPGAVRSLRLDRGEEGMLDLIWAGDCGTGTAYGIYRGDLGLGYGSLVQEPGHCSVGGNQASIPLGAGAADFFLVVPNDGATEGSYGIDSQGVPRAPAASLACYATGPIDSCAP